MIGIDWGSSNFRAYRIGPDGNVLERREAESGIGSLEATDYPAVLQQRIGDWLALDDGPVLLSGMVGSRQGWREAAYVACPAGLADLAKAFCLVDLGGGRTGHVVPGVSCRDVSGVPDVMRGEEMQIFGLDTPAGIAMACLPGTHSKHVTLQHGCIAGFATAMTGEIFALLSRHGLIAAMLPHMVADFDETGFRAGVLASGHPGGLLHHLFGVRSRRLFGELAAPAAPDFLSGLLVGHELRGTDWRGEVQIIAGQNLARRYLKACGWLGIPAAIAPEDAAARGLYRLSRHLPG
ncbi:2-dehydro-3-deoxygalactonokinase [Ferrovibrio sp.]|uniref:2-dehydro-3-deoxygalactonokinase n=1 Tax=Ferrovibrio sp. TaxID=1917215 RepID=UPI0026196F0B|nr:2-dehydro-3-deoxygalactonokinase [Ferrovibrio sp.]